MLIIAAVLALLAGCGGKSSTSAAGKAAVVYSPRAAGQAVGRLADVTKLRSGVLLTVWSGGPDAASESVGAGECWGSFSTNDGRTWSKPFLIYRDPTYDVRGTGVTQLKDGRVAVNIDLTVPGHINYQHSGSAEIVFLPALYANKAKGKGLSDTAHWKRPVSLHRLITNRAAFLDAYDNAINPVVDLGSGVLIQPFQVSPNLSITSVTSGVHAVISTAFANGYTVGTDVIISGVRGATAVNGRWTVLAQTATAFTIGANTSAERYKGGGVAAGNNIDEGGVCGILISRNGGSSWTWKKVTNTPTVNQEEPAFAKLPSGAWILATRDQGHQWVWIFRSTNQGATWSVPTILPQVYGGPRLSVTSDGSLVLFARLSSMPGVGALLLSSNGAQWTAPIPTNEGEGSVWFDYGGIAQIAPGKLIIVYSEFSSLNPPACGRVIAKDVYERRSSSGAASSAETSSLVVGADPNKPGSLLAKC